MTNLETGSYRDTKLKSYKSFWRIYAGLFIREQAFWLPVDQNQTGNKLKLYTYLHYTVVFIMYIIQHLQGEIMNAWNGLRETGTNEDEIRMEDDD